jgi:ABC-type transport system involved in cytochrome bd biosynthesis fused ATPase/permease subunit
MHLMNSSFERLSNKSYALVDEQQTMSISSTSIERLLASANTVLSDVADSFTQVSSTALCNSAAYGKSTCAKQHSVSSEDDSLPNTCSNRFVF